MSTHSTTARLFYGRQDVADALGVSLSTVKRLIADGRITTTKIGGRTMVHADDLSAFADQLRQAA